MLFRKEGHGASVAFCRRFRNEMNRFLFRLSALAGFFGWAGIAFSTAIVSLVEMQSGPMANNLAFIE
jgi:hypothetical protein